MNIEALLAAIAMVESGNSDLVIGKHGELSRYQITRAVWKTHCATAFSRQYAVAATAKIVARRQLEAIQEELPPWPIDRVYWTAAAWNCGFDRCLKSRWKPAGLPRSTRSYAARVKNLYVEYNRKESDARANAVGEGNRGNVESVSRLGLRAVQKGPAPDRRKSDTVRR